MFNKKRPDDRKRWLAEYDRQAVNPSNGKSISVSDFVDKEMIHFSKYDNERSIPSLIDGLKTSQRKVLFSAFKRKLVKGIKVSQFSGYVSENSAYHHGEASLNACIINLAQNFTGSNNVNLLEPEGQFGTRLQGGKDSASDRYIFTRLAKITRLIFRPEDECILDFKREEDAWIEPFTYYPILPLVLVNGSKGIGSGFSTSIPKYDPNVLIEEIRRRLTNCQSAPPTIIPSYRGFKGIVTQLSQSKFATTGSYTVDKLNSSVKITELPIGIWTDDYKCYLEKLMDDQTSDIRSYADLSTDLHVDITVSYTKGKLPLCSEIEKQLKLVTTVSTTNMHLFDENERLFRAISVDDIINRFLCGSSGKVCRKEGVSDS